MMPQSWFHSKVPTLSLLLHMTAQKIRVRWCHS